MPHPFVLRAAEKRVDQIAINGLPMGLFGDGGPASYDSREIELARGDVLLMLSDGLTEARVADGRELADAGLLDILAEFAGLPGAEVVAGLLKRAESLSTKEHFDDDVSMVAVTKI
jgi:sigma-B regulation protein RsbU (phosphoserine phosphatase)